MENKSENLQDQIDQLIHELKWYQTHYWKLLELVSPLLNIIYKGDGTTDFELITIIKELIYPEKKDEILLRTHLKTYKIF